MSDTILFTFISIINYKVWRTWELAQKGGGGGNGYGDKRQRKSKGATKNGTNTDTGNIDHTKTPDEDGERERERESTTKKTKIDEQHISHKKTWVNPGVHEWQVPVSNKTPTVLLIESSPI